jgi:hypothetical protein
MVEARLPYFVQSLMANGEVVRYISDLLTSPLRAFWVSPLSRLIETETETEKDCEVRKVITQNMINSLILSHSLSFLSHFSLISLSFLSHFSLISLISLSFLSHFSLISLSFLSHFSLISLSFLSHSLSFSLILSHSLTHIPTQLPTKAKSQWLHNTGYTPILCLSASHSSPSSHATAYIQGK